MSGQLCRHDWPLMARGMNSSGRLDLVDCLVSRVFDPKREEEGMKSLLIKRAHDCWLTNAGTWKLQIRDRARFKPPRMHLNLFCPPVI